jgi:CheY-like chemotaxis protein
MPAKKIVLSNEEALLVILKNSFFQREGFEMILVSDGQTGLQAVEAEEPTIAVFDLVQMGTQALECCRAIKNDPLLVATPILLLLPEDADEGLADLCWSACCDAVIPRPVSAESFLDVACSLIGISRRLARRLPVSFQLAFLDRELKRRVGSCLNLNAGGMFLGTETLFPVDTLLTIDFTLPGTRSSHQCMARVAWVNHPEWRKKNSLPCGLGLQFMDLDSNTKAMLQEFFDNLKSTY